MLEPYVFSNKYRLRLCSYARDRPTEFNEFKSQKKRTLLRKNMKWRNKFNMTSNFLNIKALWNHHICYFDRSRWQERSSWNSSSVSMTCPTAPNRKNFSLLNIYFMLLPNCTEDLETVHYDSKFLPTNVNKEVIRKIRLSFFIVF